MTGKMFVDTNLLVYMRDHSDPSKQNRAEALMRALWRDRKGVLSAQVLREYYHAVTRKARIGLDRDAARRDVRDLATWLLPETRVDQTDDAFDLQDRFGFSFFDSLIVASALGAGARALLTEDMHDGLRVGDLVLINPFRHAPQDVLGRAV
jgi:predicted nucleic acid-binding protein